MTFTRCRELLDDTAEQLRRRSGRRRATVHRRARLDAAVDTQVGKVVPDMTIDRRSSHLDNIELCRWPLVAPMSPTPHEPDGYGELPAFEPETFRVASCSDVTHVAMSA